MTNIKILDIFKIKNHTYFDNKYINIRIKLKIIKLLIIAYRHNSTEVLMIVDKTNFSDMTTSKNDVGSVNLSPKMINILANSNHNFIALHNHPSNSNFSIQDIWTFINKGSITELFVITNSCKYIAAIKKNYDVLDNRIKDNLIEFIIKYISKNKLKMKSNALDLIQELVNKNFIYIEFKNY